MVSGKNRLKVTKTRNRSVRRTRFVLVDIVSIIKGPSSIGMDVNFLNYEHVYGIPEHADAFALRSTQLV